MEVCIGIDMGGTMIKIGVVNEGKLIAIKKFDASSHLSLKERLHEIEIEVDKLLVENNCTAMGIGLAFPGIVDSDKMKILSKYVKYSDASALDLKQWAREKWNVPLALENDARAALIGEWQYGAGRGANNLVLITLGTGVGSAVLIEGKLLKGRNYLAGNLGGHMTINMNGSLCNCGNVGCLETEASSWALNEKVKATPGFNQSRLANEAEINFYTLFDIARQGDQMAVNIRNQCLQAWSLGIINLIHAYDPDRLIVGGGIMKSKDEIIPVIEKMIDQHAWSPTGSIKIVAADQVEFAGILGVSYLMNQIIA